MTSSANDWTPEQHAAYEVGHREGESCHQADWSNALNETEHELPGALWEKGGPWPTPVAAYIDKLLDEIDRLRARLEESEAEITYQCARADRIEAGRTVKAEESA